MHEIHAQLGRHITERADVGIVLVIDHKAQPDIATPEWQRLCDIGENGLPIARVSRLPAVVSGGVLGGGASVQANPQIVYLAGNFRLE